MNLLLLSYWFPCPATNGSQVRLWNLVRRLARRHRIVLLSFVDEKPGEEAMAQAESVFARVITVPMPHPDPSMLRRLAGWLSSRPASVIHFESPEMEDAVRDAVLTEYFDWVIAWELAMAPFAVAADNVPRFLEGVEATPAIPEPGDDLRGRARRWKLRSYLRELAPRYDGIGAVSPTEEAALRAVLDGLSTPVAAFPNGVDLETFAWRKPEGGRQLIYYGSPGYAANREAIDYFCAEILPLIRESEPNTTLIVTGKCKPEWIPASAKTAGVTFTGFLDDPKQAMHESACSVVPLRCGGGTRIKILEAMALGVPVVTTPVGAEGLELEAGRDALLADSAEEFAQSVLTVLRDRDVALQLSQAARKLVEEKYNWDRIAEDLEVFLSRIDREAQPVPQNAAEEGQA